MERIVKILFMCIALLWANIIQAESFSIADRDVSRLIRAIKQTKGNLDLANAIRLYPKSKYLFTEVYEIAVYGKVLDPIALPSTLPKCNNKILRNCSCLFYVGEKGRIPWEYGVLMRSNLERIAGAMGERFFLIIKGNVVAGIRDLPAPLSRFCLAKQEPVLIVRDMAFRKVNIHNEVGGDKTLLNRTSQELGNCEFYSEEEEIQINPGEVPNSMLMLSLSDEVGNPLWREKVILNVTQKNIKVEYKGLDLKSSVYYTKIFSDATDLGTKRVVVP